MPKSLQREVRYIAQHGCCAIYRVVRLGWRPRRMSALVLEGVPSWTAAAVPPQATSGSQGSTPRRQFRSGGKPLSAVTARPCVPDRCGGVRFPGCHLPTRSLPKATGRHQGRGVHPAGCRQAELCVAPDRARILVSEQGVGDARPAGELRVRPPAALSRPW